MLAAYKAIGREIVSGQQRDIDFRQFGLHEEDEEEDDVSAADAYAAISA